MTYRGPMEESIAREVVAKLRARGGFAHVHPVGVYEHSVRMVLRDGREALWDADGAAGLEAIVMRDGVLVGLVEHIPGSETFDVDQIVSAIANTDYDAPVARRASAKGRTTRPVAAAPAATATPLSGLLRRLTGK